MPPKFFAEKSSFKNKAVVVPHTLVPYFNAPKIQPETENLMNEITDFEKKEFKDSAGQNIKLYIATLSDGSQILSRREIGRGGHVSCNHYHGDEKNRTIESLHPTYFEVFEDNEEKIMENLVSKNSSKLD